MAYALQEKVYGKNLGKMCKTSWYVFGLKLLMLSKLEVIYISSIYISQVYLNENIKWTGWSSSLPR